MELWEAMQGLGEVDFIKGYGDEAVREEVKEGMKEGLKEAILELSKEIRKNNISEKSDWLAREQDF